MRRTALAALALSLSAPAFAQERATTKEAERMVHSAIAFQQKEGKEKAYAAFSDPKGVFSYRDLYIGVVSLDGHMLVNPHNKARIGKRFLDMPQEAFAQKFKQVIQQGKGWVEWEYVNPVNGKVEPKVAYAEVIDGAIDFCGAYRQ
jgi:signal transduction histidine kinase